MKPSYRSALEVSFQPFDLIPFVLYHHQISESLIASLLLFTLQVCQFVVSVNGLNVLNLDYRTVSHLILTGPRTVVMEVMEETEH